MIWHVNPKTGRDTNEGRKLDKAFLTLLPAIEAAPARDTILPAPGAYDQDLPQQISAARVADVSVGVVGAD